MAGKKRLPSFLSEEAGDEAGDRDRRFRRKARRPSGIERHSIPDEDVMAEIDRVMAEAAARSRRKA